MSDCASDDDRRTYRAIGEWKQIIRSEIDDIEAWRNNTDCRANIADHTRGWRGKPEQLFGLTAQLVGWVAIHHPNLDPKPLQDIHDAVMSWHQDHNASRLPEQNALVTLADRAVIMLLAVEQAIESRFTTTRPGEPVATHKDQHPYQFYKSGDFWNIAFEGEHGQFEDIRGFAIIQQLLRYPHPSSPLAAMALAGRSDIERGNAEDQPVLDEEAKRDYQEQIAEYDRDIEEANEIGDLPKVKSLKREKQQVIDSLMKLAGMGGKSRTLGASPEKKAQSATSQAIRRCYNRLEDDLPKLANHLRASISMGSTYAYRPANPTPDWKLD